MNPADLEDLFAPAARVSVRRMFGGFGVFEHDLMVAIVQDGVVYLKSDAETEAAFEAEGLEPFRYLAKGKTRALGFRRLPEGAYDEADVLVAWYGRARQAAARARARAVGRGGRAARVTPRRPDPGSDRSR